MKFKISPLAFLLLVSANAIAAVDISGQVLDDKGQPLSGVTVSLATQQSITNKQGFYRFSDVGADTAQLKFSASNYYSAVQSFSQMDFANWNNKIPAITLVEKKAGRVMFTFGGDVMMGRRYFKPYFNDPIVLHEDTLLEDSKRLLNQVKPYLELADFASVNLETQITADKPSVRAPKSVTFYSRPETLEALTWAGVDYVSLGNNHTYDYLDQGLNETIRHLTNTSLGYSGAGLTEDEALAASRHQLNNQSFAMLGYVGWAGGSVPDQVAHSNKGGAALGNEQNLALSIAAEVKAEQFPIVQYHGSLEYAAEPTLVTEQRLKSALDAGAVMALAHHPHVTQGFEIYDGKLIAYSLGNFVFDQNFTSTQLSYLLQVWLDNGQFYRAEVVPLFIKGYKPTPATDTERFALLKRLKTLSAPRSVNMVASGGHGVINRESQSLTPATPAILQVNRGSQIASISHLPWQSSLESISLSDDKNAYRLGVNLVNNGSFEQFSSFDSNDRNWFVDNADSEITRQSVNGALGLKLSAANGESMWFGQQSFRRVFTPGTPTTIMAQVKSQQSVVVKAYWQGRKDSEKLFDALNNGEKHLIGEFNLEANDSWQSLHWTFDSPRVGYRSYRVLLEIIPQNKGEVILDDFALIEWQTAFSVHNRPMTLNALSQQASFIEFKKPFAEHGTVKINISH